MKYCTTVFPVLVLLLTCSPSFSGSEGAGGAKSGSPRQEGGPAGKPEPGGEEVRIQFVDGRTSEAIADAEVTFDRGIVIPCIRPPCPSYERKWVRRTDREGVVAVPTEEIRQSRMTGTPQRKETAILVPGYLPRDYLETTFLRDRNHKGGSNWTRRMKGRKGTSGSNLSRRKQGN